MAIRRMKSYAPSRMSARPLERVPGKLMTVDSASAKSIVEGMADRCSNGSDDRVTTRIRGRSVDTYVASLMAKAMRSTSSPADRDRSQDMVPEICSEARD